MQLSFSRRVIWSLVGLLALNVVLFGSTDACAQEEKERDITPTLGLDQGKLTTPPDAIQRPSTKRERLVWRATSCSMKGSNRLVEAVKQL